MKKHYFYFLSLLLLNIGNVSAQYVWTQKANYGGGEVYDAFSFAIGTKGYAGSGFIEPRTYQHDFWEWDQATNVWTQKADFSGDGREGSRAFSAGGQGYVVSGFNGSSFLNDLWEYDTTSNAWSQKSSFPGTARYLGVAFSINNKGYFGLGSGPGNVCYPDVWQYDPVADLWTQEADFIGTARGATIRFVINNEAYVGLGSNVPVGINFLDFYKYDPVANSWSQLADFPGAPRNGAYCFAINDTGYVLCGYNYIYGASIIYNDFYEYAPTTNTWTQLPDFPGKASTEGIYFEMGLDGYMGVGCDTISFTHLQNEFWQYGPSAAPPISSFQSSDSVLCANDCIAFTDLSSNATSWKWLFPGATPDSSTDENPQTICYFVSGNYNVTLIASNADGSDTLQLTDYIKVNPTPPYPVITQLHDTLICSYDPSYSGYQWYYYNTPITGQIDTSLVAYYSGNYNLKVTNKYGCAISVGINIILGIDELQADSYITLYPNPVSDALTVSISRNFHNAELEIFDIYGRRLVQRTIESTKDNNLIVDFRSFASGAYFVSMNVDGERITKKVVKEISSE